MLCMGEVRSIKFNGGKFSLYIVPSTSYIDGRTSVNYENVVIGTLCFQFQKIVYQGEDQFADSNSDSSARAVHKCSAN